MRIIHILVICALVSIVMLTVLGLAERRFFPDRDYTE